jgi:hypothetical protein
MGIRLSTDQTFLGGILVFMKPAQPLRVRKFFVTLGFEGVASGRHREPATGNELQHPDRTRRTSSSSSSSSSMD